MEKGKVPPQSIELEEAILGSVLIEKEAVITAMGVLKAEYFYKDSHKRIFKIVEDLYQRSEPVDILTVVEALRKTKELDAVGGAYAVSKLTNSVASAYNLEFHSMLIKQKYIARQLIKASTDILQEAFNDTTDVFDLIAKATDSMGRISALTDLNKSINFIDHVNKIVKNVHEAKDSVELTGIPTPFERINTRTGGWQDTDLVILAARPAMGKAQPMWSRIVTDKGYRLMGDIKIGDKVANSYGSFSNVTGVFDQGSKEVYKVTFSDGTYTHCCKEHLWTVKSRADRKINRGSSVLPLEEIMKKLRVGSDRRLNYSIEFAEPVNFEKKHLPLHPYLLGILLGDGGFKGGVVNLYNPEVDIIDKVTHLLPEGDRLRKFGSYDYKVVSSDGGKPITSRLIESLGLYDTKSAEKFIPESYLHSSVEDRERLLRGLIDSDGYTQNDNCNIEYSTVSHQLKNNIVFLVESLGGVSNFKKYRGSYKKDGRVFECREYYRMNLSLPNSIFPVSSIKHREKYRPRVKKNGKFIRFVELVGSYECRCISVDAKDSLYLTDSFIATHNTSFALQVATHPVFNEGKRVMFFSLEMSASQLTARVLAQELEINTNRFTRDARHMNIEEMNSKLGEKEYVYTNNFIVDDRAGLDIGQLIIKAKTLHMKQPIDMIVIDYMQLLTDRSVHGNREQEISSISRKLKGLAKDLDIPVIALSQLSRAVESRGGDKKPILSDLRESGSIEQDADMVMFLHRPEYYGQMEDSEGNSTKGMVSCITAKYRNGSVGADVLKFVSSYTKFTNEYDATVDEFPTAIQANGEFETDAPF